MNKKYLTFILVPLLLTSCGGKTDPRKAKIKNAFAQTSDALNLSKPKKRSHRAAGVTFEDVDLINVNTESSKNLFNSFRAFTLFVEELSSSKNYSLVDGYELCTLSFMDASFQATMSLSIDEENNKTEYYVLYPISETSDQLMHIDVNYNFETNILNSFEIETHTVNTTNDQKESDYIIFNGSFKRLDTVSTKYSDFQSAMDSKMSEVRNSTTVRRNKDYSNEYTKAMNTIFNMGPAGGDSSNNELSQIANELKNALEKTNTYNDPSKSFNFEGYYMNRTLDGNLKDNSYFKDFRTYLDMFYIAASETSKLPYTEDINTVDFYIQEHNYEGSVETIKKYEGQARFDIFEEPDYGNKTFSMTFNIKDAQYFASFVYKNNNLTEFNVCKMTTNMSTEEYEFLGKEGSVQYTLLKPAYIFGVGETRLWDGNNEDTEASHAVADLLEQHMQAKINNVPTREVFQYTVNLTNEYMQAFANNQ